MSPSTPKIYIGSTIHSLEHRFKQHNRKEYKSRSIVDIFKYGDAYIQLIENFPCSKRSELEQQEGLYILNNDCTNVNALWIKNPESILPYVPS
jgi:Uri superfamily endonuclease